MGLFDFFKRQKQGKTEMTKTEKPSEEQILFTETVLEILGPVIEKFGFTRHRTETKEYSSVIIWRRNNQYIKIDSTTYPTDYPFFYSLVFGEGDSENFFEYDWNGASLTLFKNKIEQTSSYAPDFPTNEKMRESITQTLFELEKYGQSFLNNDLTMFYEIRSDLNKNREPYKIHTPDKNGKYTTSDEPRSVEQKNKYS
jgi:hypothetical protein